MNPSHQSISVILLLSLLDATPLEVHMWNYCCISSISCSFPLCLLHDLHPCGTLPPSHCTFTKLHWCGCWYRSKASGPLAVWPHGVPCPGIYDSIINWCCVGARELELVRMSGYVEVWKGLYPINHTFLRLLVQSPLLKKEWYVNDVVLLPLRTIMITNESLSTTV